MYFIFFSRYYVYILVIPVAVVFRFHSVIITNTIIISLCINISLTGVVASSTIVMYWYINLVWILTMWRGWWLIIGVLFSWHAFLVKGVVSLTDGLFLSFLLFATDVYPKFIVGLGFWVVGLPSGKWILHILESLLGCQFRPFSSFLFTSLIHCCLLSLSCNWVGKGNKVKGGHSHIVLFLDYTHELSKGYSSTFLTLHHCSHNQTLHSFGDLT